MMGRKREYDSDAERARSWRQRQTDEQERLERENAELRGEIERLRRKAAGAPKRKRRAKPR